MVFERSRLIVLNPLLPSLRQRGYQIRNDWNYLDRKVSPNWPTMGSRRCILSNQPHGSTLANQQGMLREIRLGPRFSPTALMVRLTTIGRWPREYQRTRSVRFRITRRRPESRRAGREGQQPYGRIPLAPPTPRASNA